MADRKELEGTIRTRIIERRLPRFGPHRLFGGQGDGKPCAACDRSITRREAQFDIELTADPRNTVELSMHRDCYDVWRNQSLMLQKGFLASGEPPAEELAAVEHKAAR